ncbi:CoA transferase [Streptomyces muensis]|uniref:CoA transferase n=1 Tax=Streptomyces muensis TaxID=1077944 RepID=A0A9X1PRT2_STRM4|nr:CoA transferase [Streptomyces muensis]MCF1592335.1 CoA transferase [Streptomyces muensis]
MTREDIEQWARSGAMTLTGRADGYGLGPPGDLVSGLRAITAAIAEATHRLGREIRVSPLELLAERAAVLGLSRQGSTSCGGASRILRAADGWFALTLSRTDDVDMLPAWLMRDVRGGDDPWTDVEGPVARMPMQPLVERGIMLGLPIAALPSERVTTARSAAFGQLPVAAAAFGHSAAVTRSGSVRVVDLSSLWAGPLCTSVLHAAGADVIKVESVARPDGARRGPAAFFDLMHAGKRSVALDFRTASGRTLLKMLIDTADVVVEGSRPRALEQLGIDAVSVLTAGRPKVWISITGHGRSGSARHRVGFGDDAAVAGGLVVWDDDEPLFCADAVADPATGLVAAAAALTALTTEGSWLVDVSLANVAAHLSGPGIPVPKGLRAWPPVARRPVGRAARLGQHTQEVIEEVRGLR